MDKPQSEGRKQVSREEVKLLAISVGVREAAKQIGLNENTVLSWSKRDQWFVNPPKPPSVQSQNGVAINAITSPADALTAQLEDDSKETKLSLSRSVRRGAKALEDELPAIAVFTGADKVKHLVGAASQLHGWEQKEQGNVDLHLNILAGQSQINFNGLNPEHAGS